MIPTAEVTQEIRKQLKKAFPGVTFSVRKGTGTASAWIDVIWEGDPPTADVAAICNPWEQRRDAVVEGINYSAPHGASLITR